MRSREIKELSIALEALSRFPNTESLSDRIRSLLDFKIAEEEATQTQYPTKTNPDDEIPF